MGKHRTCRACKGTGDCRQCKGSGKVGSGEFALITFGVGTLSKFTCKRCDGSGRCERCQGKGEVIVR